MAFKIILSDRIDSFYTITSASKTMIGIKNIEFVQDKLVNIKLAKHDDSSYQLRYNHIYQQTQGTSLIHEWSGDLESLYEDILFHVSNKGDLLDIINFKDLEHKWKEMLPFLKRKYPQSFFDLMEENTNEYLKDKNSVMKSFIGYSSWRFFFQNHYREYKAEEKDELTLKKYFGEIDLPLNLNKKVKNDEEFKGINIIQNATLNKQLFQRNKFSRMLKDLTGIYNISAELNIDMEELYVFSNNDEFVSGDLFLETSVSDWYSITSAHQLRKISEEECGNLYNDFINQSKPKERPPSPFLVD